ncbi:hypothetical protein EVA_10423 [gut metagenome]|uniref:Uncharacterized protein n=1 Tax=gut metagenome TaxID=749906 RepID=J9G2L5_9ZZZZ
MRSSPSDPWSSRPGVSINTTGPSGSSSIDLKTGSVVVPLISETIARFCPVSALIRLDFPAFLLPKIPMWIRSEEGVACKLISVLKSFLLKSVLYVSLAICKRLEAEISSIFLFDCPQVIDDDRPHFFIWNLF